MPREIGLPRMIERRLSALPAKIPFESKVDRVLDRVAQVIAGNPISSTINRVFSMVPRVSEVDMPTPLGRIRLPEISVPMIAPPDLNENRREALKAAIGVDVSSLVGVIPVVVDIASDVIEDVFGENIKRSLSSQELSTYMRYDKLGPSTYAMMRTFARR